MPEITQKLGFEAKDAISTIGELTTALASMNTKLRAFNKAASAANGEKVATGMKKVSGAAKKATKSVGELDKKLEKTGKVGAANINKITFAWSGLAKAMLARTVVQAITNVTGAINDSAQAAADWEETIARISNIAEGPGGSIDELSESLANLSVELGRPQAEVLSAAYEALQNDLGSTKDTMDLLANSANDLALITGGTLTQSVNSLSSVLKAYDMDINQAAAVSDIFFAAIDKGRISLAELESSLGKITPLAAKLDIEFGQVAGAMAAITQSGTTASVANTQLRSIFQKLIRPTKELQKAFNILGVDTFNELIANSGNLQNALEDIADALDNDDRAIAKAFGRLRGQLGVFNLLANEGKIFEETMIAVSESAGRAAEAADRIKGTQAVKARQAWEEFNKTMREMGETVLKLKTNFIKLFNGIITSGEQAIKAIFTLGVALGTATIAVKLFGVSAGVAFAWMIPAVLAAGIIWNLVDAIDAATNGYKDSADAAEKFTEAVKVREIAEINEQMSKDTEAIKTEAKDQIQIIGDMVSEIDKEYDRLKANTESRVKQIKDISDAVVDSFVGSVRGIITGIDNTIAGIEDRVNGLFEAARDTAATIKDLEFEASLEGLTKAEVAAQRLNDLMSKQGDIREAVAKVDLTPESSEALTKAGAEARKAADKNVQAARRTGDAETINRALRARIKTLKIYETAQKASAFRIMALEEGIDQDKLQKNKADMAELERIAKDIKALDDPNGKEAKALAGEFQAALDKVDVDFLGKFGQSQALKDALNKFQTGLDALTVQFPNAHAELQAALDSAPFQAQVELLIKDPTGDAVLDQKLQEAAKIEKPGDALAGQRQAFADFQVAQTRATAAAKKYASEAVADYKSVETQLEKMTKAGQAAQTDRGDPILKAGEKVKAELNAILDQIKTASATEKAALEAQLNALEASVKAGIKPGELAVEQAEAVLSAIDSARSALDSTLKQKAQEAIANPELLGELKEHFNSMAENAAKIGLGLKPDKFALIAGSTKSAALDSVQLSDMLASADVSSTGLSTSMSTMATGINAAAKSALALATAAEAAAKAALVAAKAAAAAKAAGGSKYHGGKVAYRAAGGPTRGLDTQLTATSPGEFITNARSSRQFFSELQAMNAGQSPQHRDKGGPVTNIGDINVNITSEAAEPQLGRQIARELERELRFKTSTLR